jgi:hypothetical protein
VIEVRDLGDLVQLRWAVVLEKPGKRPKLIAAFGEVNEATAYAMQRRRAEERVGARR